MSRLGNASMQAPAAARQQDEAKCINPLHRVKQWEHGICEEGVEGW